MLQAEVVSNVPDTFTGGMAARKATPKWIQKRMDSDNKLVKRLTSMGSSNTLELYFNDENVRLAFASKLVNSVGQSAGTDHDSTALLSIHLKIEINTILNLC